MFDSDDDSDDEQSLYMTADRKGVLNFLNEAKPNELLTIKGFTAKKMELFEEIRPFRDWADLTAKLQSSKGMSTDMMNACQDFLYQRNNMIRIMEKCGKLVKQLELAVARGGGSVTQPTIINPEFKLADYQVVGLNWLAVIHSQNMNGILADEVRKQLSGASDLRHSTLQSRKSFNLYLNFVRLDGPRQNDPGHCILGVSQRGQSLQKDPPHCRAFIDHGQLGWRTGEMVSRISGREVLW